MIGGASLSIRKRTVCCIIGTRPEAIKMAPVIIRLRESQLLEPFVLATGQHTEMLSQALDFFGINPDKDLAIMRKNQSLDYVTSSVIEKVGHVLDDLRPFFVLVHATRQQPWRPHWPLFTGGSGWDT